MPEDIVRAFFGFNLPPEVARRAAGLRTLVDDPKRAVRWVKGTNIHLTVRFLGATPRKAVEEIAAAIQKQLEESSALHVRIEGTGVFPTPTRPRVLWLGITGDIARLQELENSVHQVVEPMGFPREKREFMPHITLGRVRYPQKITPDVAKFLHAVYEPVDCPLKALHLYESRLGNKGITYIRLATFPFKLTCQEKS